MPADRPTTGTGLRRQGSTEPDRPDDSVRSLERSLEDEEARDENAVRSRGRQPGAHGTDAPHQNVKPGTQRAIEEADPRSAD
jgi:hypothetical protein